MSENLSNNETPRFRIMKKFKIIPPRKKTFQVIEDSPTTYNPEILLQMVQPITKGGISTTELSQLEHLVEYPILEACRKLNQKGIKTVMSSANYKDVTIGYAHIIIEIDNLSPYNLQIANKLGEHCVIKGSSKINCIELRIAVNVSSTVGEIIQESNNIADQFENQSNQKTIE